VIDTLVQRAFTLSDEESRNSEIRLLKSVHVSNGHNAKNVNNAIRKAKRTFNANKIPSNSTQTIATNHTNNNEDSRETVTRAYMPYIGKTSRIIGRIFQKYKVKTIFKSHL
jgi:hypothetical protein